MILRIGTYENETTGEVKDRYLIFGHLIKDAEFSTVGKKGTSKLEFVVNTGKGEPLVRVKLWGYDAVDYADTRKGTTVLVDTYEDVREYQGKTYKDYTMLNLIALSRPYGRTKKAGRSAKVEPEEPQTEDGFTDIASDDLPWETSGDVF